jgi:hypothetical protein
VVSDMSATSSLPEENGIEVDEPGLDASLVSASSSVDDLDVASPVSISLCICTFANDFR